VEAARGEGDEALPKHGVVLLPGQVLDHHFSRFREASLKEAVSADAGSVWPSISRTMLRRILIARKAGGRAVDELGDVRLALGDLATPAILGDDDELVERVTRQRLQVLGSG
jgi:hypothetical protein